VGSGEFFGRGGGAVGRYVGIGTRQWELMEG